MQIRFVDTVEIIIECAGIDVKELWWEAYQTTIVVVKARMREFQDVTPTQSVRGDPEITFRDIAVRHVHLTADRELKPDPSPLQGIGPKKDRVARCSQGLQGSLDLENDLFLHSDIHSGLDVEGYSRVNRDVGGYDDRTLG